MTVARATVENNLAELRQRRGIPVARLAAMVGVSRQSVYAIEAGAFAPNTEIALMLARALDYTVEELFRLRECPPLGRSRETRRHRFGHKMVRSWDTKALARIRMPRGLARPRSESQARSRAKTSLGLLPSVREISSLKGP